MEDEFKKNGFTEIVVKMKDLIQKCMRTLPQDHPLIPEVISELKKIYVEFLAKSNISAQSFQKKEDNEKGKKKVKSLELLKQIMDDRFEAIEKLLRATVLEYSKHSFSVNQSDLRGRGMN